MDLVLCRKCLQTWRATQTKSSISTITQRWALLFLKWKLSSNLSYVIQSEVLGFLTLNPRVGQNHKTAASSHTSRISR